MIHKRIIGGCWLVIGALIVSLLVLNVAGTSTQVLAIGSVISLVYIVAGLALMVNVQRLGWLYLTCAALSLFTFPVGTAVGVYYLWYFFAVEKIR